MVGSYLNPSSLEVIRCRPDIQNGYCGIQFWQCSIAHGIMVSPDFRLGC